MWEYNFVNVSRRGQNWPVIPAAHTLTFRDDRLDNRQVHPDLTQGTRCSEIPYLRHSQGATVVGATLMKAFRGPPRQALRESLVKSRR